MTWKEIPQFMSRGNYAVDFPLEYLVKHIEKEQEESHLQLNPDFQRGHVWTKEQQQAYIEFILRGGTSGKDIYFNCPSWHRSVPTGAYNDYVCVDGLQRITAIQKFVHNELEVFGQYYSDFGGKSPISLTIKVHVNDLKTKADVLRWYLEMNTGGTIHTKSEIQRVTELLKKEQEFNGG